MKRKAKLVMITFNPNFFLVSIRELVIQYSIHLHRMYDESEGLYQNSFTKAGLYIANAHRWRRGKRPIMRCIDLRRRFFYLKVTPK